MQTVAFGYKCQECGQGMVLEKVIPEYRTKLKGYPLTVENARIGVCNLCGAEHFSPIETMRWKSLLQEKQAASYLQPDEIREIRKQIGLSMEQFAAMIGCTRQSLYNWERSEREAPQSRMADVFMRLVREAHLVGSIEVLKFLTSEAEKLGIQLDLPQKTTQPVPLFLTPRKISAKLVSRIVEETLALTADTETPSETVVMVTDHEQQLATLFYDYTAATLNLHFLHSVPFDEFDADISFKDGTSVKRERALIKNYEATLIAKTARTEDDIAAVKVVPREIDVSVKVPSK